MKNDDKLDNRYSPILDSYFIQIDKLYEKNPSFVIDELNNLIRKFEVEKLKNKSFLDKLFTGKDKELILSIFLMILMLPMCLFTINNIQMMPVFFFGYVFFMAGVNIGFSERGAGLIFLFSHGGTGMAIMMWSLLSKAMGSGLFTDGGRNLIVYLVLNITIIIIGFLAMVVYNLSDYVRNKRYIKSYILLIFIIGLAMAGIFPYIMKIIYSL